jgi:hypothetical protein
MERIAVLSRYSASVDEGCGVTKAAADIDREIEEKR